MILGCCAPHLRHPHILQKREAFCQLLQLMKIQHSNLDEPEIISVYVGTWNMGKGPGEGGLVLGGCCGSL